MNMNNKELLKVELDKRNAFTTPLPDWINELVDTIPNDRIDKKMRLTIAISELILFASQFRRNILHFNGSLIPINAITFCISASGTGKDSSISTLKKSFNKAYARIQEKRIDLAKQRAKDICKDKGLDESKYMTFYEDPPSLSVSTSTNEGFIQHLNELDCDGIGSASIYSGEIGAELASSTTIMDNIKLLSELYDEGKKEVKMLKDKSKQSKEIKNLPVHALFMGSPENILYDSTVKNKFKTEFETKLARRSFFSFSMETPKQKEYSNIADFLNDKMKQEDKARDLIDRFNDQFESVAIHQLTRLGECIKMSDEVRQLCTLYKGYNEECSEEIKTQYKTTKLVVKHLYWKALKLSGALALIKGRDEILAKDYTEAISFVEMLNKDMENFDKEMNKEPYEVFANMCHKELDEDNRCFTDVHTLKKMGFITGSTDIAKKTKDLASLASSYDKTGIYRATEKGIEYSKFVEVSTCGISFLKCKGTKAQRANLCAKGFKYETMEFNQIRGILEDDFVYCPYKFEDGIRSKEKIIGGIKWLALDVDNSDYTDEQMHEILKPYNHHIARTSDPDNAYKFRILLELDSIVHLDDKQYKSFILSVADYIGKIKIDVLPRAQIFFSYANRNILSYTDGKPLATRDHLLYSYSGKEYTNFSTLSTAEKKAKLADEITTFSYAFEAQDGEGSLMLYRAAKHARDLGMSQDGVISLLERINDYWVSPMPSDRFENTIIKQVKSWSF